VACTTATLGLAIVIVGASVESMMMSRLRFWSAVSILLGCFLGAWLYFRQASLEMNAPQQMRLVQHVRQWTRVDPPRALQSAEVIFDFQANGTIQVAQAPTNLNPPLWHTQIIRVMKRNTLPSCDQMPCSEPLSCDVGTSWYSLNPITVVTPSTCADGKQRNIHWHFTDTTGAPIEPKLLAVDEEIDWFVY
jgi:hypothetical protein